MMIKDYAMLGVSAIFLIFWFLRAKPGVRPENYRIVPFDIYGNKSSIDGIRDEFKTFDVAWSFMKDYKERYPLWNFALVGKYPDDVKDTIFKYL